MKTTLTLDDDVTALVTREVKRRKTSLKAVVNDALRQGLAEHRDPPGPRKPFHTRTVNLGAPRIDIDNVWEALALERVRATVDPRRREPPRLRPPAVDAAARRRACMVLAGLGRVVQNEKGTAMLREFLDKKEHVVHDEFQEWRTNHQDGVFLTLETKTRANLHGTRCKHLGSGPPYFLANQGWGSLTAKRKVCGPEQELIAWAISNGVTTKGCQDCLRQRLITLDASGMTRPLQQQRTASPSGQIAVAAEDADLLPAPLSIFGFGYWGWGSVTEKLVEATDAVEASRGFRPPVFVDIRISRSVRAAGFRDGAFEKTVGSDRYVWMRGLGNKAVKEGRVGIDIAEPQAAEELLDLARDRGLSRQRVILYCACEFPGSPSEPQCHRTVVGEILLDAARRRGLPIEVVEWPGGVGLEVELHVTKQELKRVSGASNVRLPVDAPLAKWAALPWPSVLKIVSGDEGLLCLSGPAKFASGRWCLPTYSEESYGSTLAEFRRASRRMRKEQALEPRRSDISR